MALLGAQSYVEHDRTQRRKYVPYVSSTNVPDDPCARKYLMIRISILESCVLKTFRIGALGSIQRIGGES